MPKTFVLFAVGFGVLIVPALAGQEFYILEDASSSTCAIVEATPSAASLVLIAINAYRTAAQAQAAMTVDSRCLKKANDRKPRVDD